MNPATTEFVRQRFTDYYRKALLVSPSSLAQREWGFVLFNPGAAEMRMRRHIAFSERAESLRLHQKSRPLAYLLLERILRETGCTHHG